MVPHNIHKILERVSVYPEKEKNYYKVELIAIKDDKFNYPVVILHKSEVELWRLINQLKLNGRDTKELYDLIGAYGDFKYDKGTSDTEMSYAGANL